MNSLASPATTLSAPLHPHHPTATPSSFRAHPQTLQPLSLSRSLSLPNPLIRACPLPFPLHRASHTYRLKDTIMLTFLWLGVQEGGGAVLGELHRQHTPPCLNCELLGRRP